MFQILDVILKIVNSFILSEVIKSVIDNDKDDAYFWAGMLAICSFFVGTFRHNAWNSGTKLSGYI